MKILKTKAGRNMKEKPQKKSGKGHEGEATDDDKCFKH